MNAGATTPVEPALHIDVPPGFGGIPLTDSAGINARVRELAHAAAGSGAVSTSAEDLVEYLGALAHLMGRERVRLFGRFAVSDQTTPEPVLANLALAMPRLDVDPDQLETLGDNRRAIAKELVKQYRRRFPDADVHDITLDVGPAMVAQRAGEYRIPAAASPSESEVIRDEFKAEFHVPSPDATRLVVMTITTDSEAGWPLVAAEAMRIANSIRFVAREEPTERRDEHSWP